MEVLNEVEFLKFGGIVESEKEQRWFIGLRMCILSCRKGILKINFCESVTDCTER